MKQVEETFWMYWKKRWPFATENKKILELSANYKSSKEAYIAGWKDSIKNKWHDAEKEKPENYETVLIHVENKDDDEFLSGFFDSDENIWFYFINIWDVEEIENPLRVISWMHIPKNEGEE